MSTRAALLVLLVSIAPLAARAQSEPADAPAAAEGEGDDAEREPPVEHAEPAPDPGPSRAGAREPARSSAMAAELRQREDVRPWHVAFGTATGIATYATTILGFLTFNDRYGWTGNAADTGCASGSPIFGAAACGEPPLSHLVAASTASTLFAVTFTLALFMPDPLGVDQGGGERATLLTIHKALRWGLLGLFVTQLVLGTITAAAGIDDFGTRRDLAVTHLVLGVVTNVAMTTQGILGSIMEW
ncbi:MAG: hypothetical protein KF729_33810 [Sandaracinaceae bacterium]|nr:hypothetical protein [Sandaracinaceae bacterium]